MVETGDFSAASARPYYDKCQKGFSYDFGMVRQQQLPRPSRFLIFPHRSITTRSSAVSYLPTGFLVCLKSYSFTLMALSYHLTCGPLHSFLLQSRAACGLIYNFPLFLDACANEMQLQGDAMMSKWAEVGDPIELAHQHLQAHVVVLLLPLFFPPSDPFLCCYLISSSVPPYAPHILVCCCCCCPVVPAVP